MDTKIVANLLRMLAVAIETDDEVQLKRFTSQLKEMGVKVSLPKKVEA